MIFMLGARKQTYTVNDVTILTKSNMLLILKFTIYHFKADVDVSMWVKLFSNVNKK